MSVSVVCEKLNYILSFSSSTLPLTLIFLVQLFICVKAFGVARINPEPNFGRRGRGARHPSPKRALFFCTPVVARNKHLPVFRSDHAPPNVVRAPLGREEHHQAREGLPRPNEGQLRAAGDQEPRAGG